MIRKRRSRSEHPVAAAVGGLPGAGELAPRAGIGRALADRLQPNTRDASGGDGLSARFWLLTVLTGAGAGLAGGLLMKLLKAIQHAAWSYQSGDFLDAVERASPERHILILFCAGLIAGLGGWILRSAFKGESADVAGAIWFREGRLSAIPALVQAVISIVIVGMGASLGREGALKHAGAVIASRFSSLASLPSPQVRILTAIGAGAGMAAAYNVPCGGALFALEVLLGSLKLRLVAPALAGSGIATLVSWLLLSDRATYAVPNYSLGIREIVWAFLAGPLLGLAAVGFIRTVSWAARCKPRGKWMAVVPPIALTLLGGISIACPQLLGNGKDLVQGAYAQEFGLSLLLFLPVLKMLATAGCLASGAPGGLFTPTMACGATLGALLGCAFRLVWPDAPLGTFAVLGSGAMLAAATKGPISAVVLLLELTRRVDASTVPLLIAVASATLVAARLERKSIYSARLHSEPSEQRTGI